ncbi:MAG TPA: hypothetical protein GX744_06600 [Firmicutes bacterium]|jgi:hypothetical protein|nr:hypothetical protein [Bacillota bacterium]
MDRGKTRRELDGKTSPLIKKNSSVLFRLFMVCYTLDDIIIWDRGRSTAVSGPWAFPVSCVNKVHEYLLIF